MGRISERITRLEDEQLRQKEFLADFKVELIKRFDASDLKLQAIHSTTQEIMIHNARQDSEFETAKQNIANLRKWKNGLVNTALASSLAGVGYWLKHKFFGAGQ